MAQWWNRKRFDAIELILLASFAAFATSLFPRTVTPWVGYVALRATEEAEALKRDYGPNRYSEHLEEWVIRDFFKDMRGGFFVDVGANDYKHDSNTYYLEKYLDWKGIAIEPQRQFEADYLKYRPKTRFFPFFVDQASNETARLYISSTMSLVTSADKSFAARWGGTVKEMTAPTITLNDLFEHERVGRIDLISIDVELHEPQVLAGFDVERFKPALVCVEAHPEVRQQILTYFARHGYVAVGKYLRSDTENIYFTPLQ